MGVEEALGSSLSLGSRGVSKVVSELLSLWSFPAPRKNYLDTDNLFHPVSQGILLISMKMGFENHIAGKMFLEV